MIIPGSKWLITMVDRFRPLRIRLWGPLPNGLNTWLINGDDPITTEPSTGKPILQVASVSSDPVDLNDLMICCIFFWGGMKYYPVIPRILLRGWFVYGFYQGFYKATFFTTIWENIFEIVSFGILHANPKIQWLYICHWIVWVVSQKLRTERSEPRIWEKSKVPKHNNFICHCYWVGR